MRDSDRKLYRASIVDRYVKGRMDRRSFLRAAGQLGLGVGALGLAPRLPRGVRLHLAGGGAGADRVPTRT